MEKNKILPIVAGTVFSLVFGLSYIFTKGALDYVEVFFLLGYRFAVAASLLSLLGLFGFVKFQFKGKKKIPLALLVFFEPIIYFYLETVGLKMTSSSEAGLMLSLVPIIVIVLAAIFLKERPSTSMLFFILLSVFGAIFIVIMQEKLISSQNFIGLYYLAGAILASGFFNILSRKISTEYTPMEITFIMMWAGALFYNFIAINQANWDILLYLSFLQNQKVLIATLYLGIFSSCIAFLLVNYTLSRIEASLAGVFSNLITVVAVIAGILFLNETFYWFQFIGGVMIIIGVYGVNYVAGQSKFKYLETEKN